MFDRSVPQHRRLLHQPSHREKDLHAVHGRVQRALCLHVPPRDDLPRRQAPHQGGTGPAREREARVCRQTRTTRTPGPEDRSDARREPAEPEQEGESQRGAENDGAVGHTVQSTRTLSIRLIEFLCEKLLSTHRDC